MCHLRLFQMGSLNSSKKLEKDLLAKFFLAVDTLRDNMQVAIKTESL